MRSRKGTPPSGDAAGAARRRLAALAAQFENAAHPVEPPGQPDAPLSLGRHAARSADDEEPAHEEPSHEEPFLEEQAAAPLRRRLAEHGRWGISHQHLTLALLTVIAVVALAGWWVLRSVPSSEPVQITSSRTLPTSGPAETTPTGAAIPAASSGSAPATPAGATVPGSSAAATVVVDVAGKVRRPGIVELPAGSRVVDALHRAGGVRPRVDTTALNLARVLVDGEQIVVGLEIPQIAVPPADSVPTSAGAPSAGPSPVDLNTATPEQLETLPDIGPVTAAAIVTWRTENGSFTSVDELLEVSGIGDATLANVAPFVFV